LLRKDPNERLTTEDVLIHPWLARGAGTGGSGSTRERIKRTCHVGLGGLDSADQTVPEFVEAKKAKHCKMSKSAGVKSGTNNSNIS
jgi:hypothetical protein